MDPSYNNSLGSAGAMQQPIASGTGDIVLPQEKGGGAKKWWIVGVVVGIIAIVVVVVLFVVMRSGGQVSKQTSNNYNRLANYVLYGENSDNSIGTSINIDETDFAVTSALNDNNSGPEVNMVDYFAKLYQLNDDFMRGFDLEGANEEVSYLVNDINNIVSFLHEYSSFSDPNVDALAALYGRDEDYVESYVNNYYSVFNNSDNEYSQRYGTIKQEILRLEAEVSVKHNFFGACLGSGASNSKCEESLAGISETELVELRRGDEEAANAVAMVEEDTRMLVYDVVELAKMLYGETK